MKQLVDRNKIVIRVMDQPNTDSGGQPPAEGAEAVQSAAGTMTYANLETLTRLNPEDLSTILSTGSHQRDHGNSHYGDSASAGDEPSGYIVTMAAEASGAEAYTLAEQTSYVVTASTGAQGNDSTTVVEDAGADTEAPAMDPQLSGHSYCKPSMRVHAAGTETIGPGGAGEEVDGAVETAVRGGIAGSLGDAVVARHNDLLDLKTVMPGSTTRRLLLIDDGHGDLEMAKSDVEFLLRGDAATIVLREGKRSEVWSRFGKVTFQGRKVKGYVACIFCRQVYAFGDAHSTGTSTLKKHRCLAQSLVSTSPMTPTNALASPSPAPSVSQENSYVNFPSPSVIVSISTMRNSESTEHSFTTRILSPTERDDVIRTSAMAIACPTACFFNAVRVAAELGARHGAQVTEDLSAILKTSPLMETILPSLAFEYRSHFAEEARTLGHGVAVILDVLEAGPKTVQLTLKLSYALSLPNANPLMRQVPLRQAALLRDIDFSRNVAHFVRRTLKDEKLDHIRRALVCNDPEVLDAAFRGETVAICAQTAMSRALEKLLETTNHDWDMLLGTMQKIANKIQVAGPETSISRNLRPASKGIDLVELIPSFGSQLNEIQKLWQDQKLDAAVLAKIDRVLLNQVVPFFLSLQSLLSKTVEVKSEPSLHMVILLRSSIASLCRPRPTDVPAMLFIKDVLSKAVKMSLRIDVIHTISCLLHPAFKQMRKLDVTDQEKAEALSTIRELVRQDTSAGDAILRSTLESCRNGEAKRKNSKNDSTPGAKRQRTGCATVSGAAGSQPSSDSGFEWCEWADFNASAIESGTCVPEKSELENYMEEKLTQQDLGDLNNVLVYWKNRKNIFPSLSRLAFWIFALPSSVDRLTAHSSDSSITQLVLQSVAPTTTVTTSAGE